MEAQSYTRLDRGSLLRTLESRLSMSRNTVQGPQVQLFRVNSPPNTPPPNFTMPHWKPGEESPREEPSEDVDTTTSSDHLTESYNKRIQVMQSIINQLRKDRQEVEDDLKEVREELYTAKIRITSLENELERSAGDLKTVTEERDKTVENSDRYRKEAEEAGKRCGELEDANKGLATQCAIQESYAHTSNDVIRIHNVVWGSQTIYDEALNQKLLEYAARGSTFAATRDFVDYDVRPGERRTLVVAYSKAANGPVRWLVVDESQSGMFNLD